jgi:hypothetical protein
MSANFDPFMAWEGVQGSVDKNGLENVNVSYYVPTLAQARYFIAADVINSLGLAVMRRTYSQEWGNGRLIDLGADGAYKITWGLEGMTNPQDGENGVQFSADATLAEDKPEAHPDLQSLMDKYDGSIDDTGKLTFAPTITVNGNDIKNPLYGWSKWRSAGVTWTKTYLTLAPSSSVTYMLNKIDQPPVGPNGYLPQLPGKRNWLKTVGKPDWRGNIWKVTESWEMSGDGGWNEDVYR